MWRLLPPGKADLARAIVEANDHRVHHQMSEGDGIAGALTLCARHGGILVFEAKGEVVGVILFTLGTPDDLYQRTRTGYIYFMAVNQAGGFRVFPTGLVALASELMARDCLWVRFRGDLRVPRNIRLYEKFAAPIERSKNAAGHASILFETSPRSIISALERYVDTP